MCELPPYSAVLPLEDKKITVQFTIDEARQLGALLRHARTFAWKLKDAIKAHEDEEARRKDWPHSMP